MFLVAVSRTPPTCLCPPDRVALRGEPLYVFLFRSKVAPRRQSGDGATVVLIVERTQTKNAVPL
ncbi:MAG: hypothetical protein K2X93_14410 [Candidatus Obscuribacterales bacterium]|nr:hypothetical protein [Candidatus Obscuribacterales bacterium]